MLRQLESSVYWNREDKCSITFLFCTTKMVTWAGIRPFQKRKLFAALFKNAMCVFRHTATSFESKLSTKNTTITCVQHVNGFQTSVCLISLQSYQNDISHRSKKIQLKTESLLLFYSKRNNNVVFINYFRRIQIIFTTDTQK